MEQRNNINLFLYIQLAKVNNKMNEKISQEYQSMDPEYVTGQINSHILEFFWDSFVIWVLHHLKNLNMLQLQKIF